MVDKTRKSVHYVFAQSVSPRIRLKGKGNIMELLTAQHARELVKRITRVVPYELCLTDMSGTVIAGTDAFSVGQTLAGARRAVEGQEAQIVYKSRGDEKMGIFFPLWFSEQMQGVVFIAGEIMDVMPIGQIVASLAEALMQNTAVMEINAVNEKRMNDFLFEWTVRKPQEFDDYFLDLASYYGIDLTVRRRAVLIELRRIRYSLLDQVKNLLKAGEFIARQTIDSVMQLMLDNDELEERVQKILSLSPDFGCCTVGAGGNAVSESVSTAYQTQRIVKALGEKEKLFYYEQYALECLLIRARDTREIERIQSTLRGNDPEGILFRTIRVYAARGTDKAAVCRELYVHRNTLGYRLGRIRQLTGLDPHVPRELMLLYAAALTETMSGGALQ